MIVVRSWLKVGAPSYEVRYAGVAADTGDRADHPGFIGARDSLCHWDQPDRDAGGHSLAAPRHEAGRDAIAAMAALCENWSANYRQPDFDSA